MKKFITAMLLSLSLQMLALFPAAATDELETKTYILGVKNNINIEEFIAEKKIKAKKVSKLKNINAVVLEVYQIDVNSLEKDGNLEYIEADANVRLASIDTGATIEEYAKLKSKQLIPWGFSDIGAVSALKNKITGKKIKVAVLDTGIEKHKDLNIAGGISLVTGVDSYTDDNGHGAHVAGTIAALNNNYGIIGIAPCADIYAVKVLDKTGTGTYSQVIQGIDWAIENDIEIISMSFSGSMHSQALHDIIRKADENGIIVVAAAGNMGAELLFPAKYSEVVSVGAVDRNHQRAAFSNIGSELDLVAPGVEILSTTLNMIIE